MGVNISELGISAETAGESMNHVGKILTLEGHEPVFEGLKVMLLAINHINHTICYPLGTEDIIRNARPIYKLNSTK